MKKLLVLIGLMLVALPAVAGAAEEVKSGTKEGKPYFEASEKTTEQATVIKVEKASRLVTMRDDLGDTLSIKAGDEVKNFAQIKVGDVVKVTYTEELTIHVEAAGAPEMTSEKTTEAAKPGEKPAASVTERTKYKATITAIDKKSGTATLKSYDGEEFVITPLHPENLDKVKLGELVVFTHTQAVAMSVEKVAKKK
jgi:hypothetical protein